MKPTPKQPVVLWLSRGPAGSVVLVHPPVLVSTGERLLPVPLIPPREDTAR